jgi:hypothetical protein
MSTASRESRTGSGQSSLSSSPLRQWTPAELAEAIAKARELDKLSPVEWIRLERFVRRGEAERLARSPRG